MMGYNTSYSLTMLGWFSFFMTAISCTTSVARGVARMLALRDRVKLSAKPVLGVELALAKPLRWAICSKEGRGTSFSARLLQGAVYEALPWGHRGASDVPRATPGASRPTKGSAKCAGLQVL